MNKQTINITLTLAQADVLSRYLKQIADSIEGQAVAEALGINFPISLEKRIEGTRNVGAHKTST